MTRDELIKSCRYYPRDWQEYSDNIRQAFCVCEKASVEHYNEPSFVRMMENHVFKVLYDEYPEIPRIIIASIGSYTDKWAGCDYCDPSTTQAVIRKVLAEYLSAPINPHMKFESKL